MKCDLLGKVVVVTGASRGIGRKITERLTSEGAKVVINYKLNDKAAEELCNILKKNGGEGFFVKADISDEKQVRNLYVNTLKQFGKIDVLINNAGMCSDNYIQFMSERRWDEVINTNLKGTFLSTRIFSKQMVRQQKGKIINISSLKGQLGSEGQSNYAASKAALIGFTKSIAKEVGSFGISVNAICPGYITTDLNRGNTLKSDIARKMSTLDINFALEDLLNFIIWMCSDRMQGISGQVFNLDSRII